MNGMVELWKFQEADMALIQYQNDVKASPVRKKLAQARDVLKDGQNTMHSMESTADKNRARVSGLDTRREQLSDKLNALLGGAKEQDLEDLKAIQAAIKEAEELQNEMTSIRKEYSAIIAGGEAGEKKVGDLKRKLGKAKSEYIELKAKFEEETKRADTEIKRLKESLDKASKTVDKALLRKYMAVRKNCIPAVAMVEHGQCTGCNMSLPSLTMHNIKDSPELVECENCGRILYMP